MPIYQKIGEGYNQTRRADPYIASRLALHLQIQPYCRYLDLACGTGNYARALAAIAGTWHGVDESAMMIGEAARKDDLVDWVLGLADFLPYLDGAFTGAVCTLAIHHFGRLGPAFHEIYRVIQRGRFVIFTSTPDRIRLYWLSEYFPDAIRMSAEQMPALDTVTRSLRRAGFDLVATEPYWVRSDLQDLFLYSGKWRPELYLDPKVRAGISTFAMFASPSEVHDGCEKLAADVYSGMVSEVIRKYQDEAGDYLFVVAEKR